MEAAKFTKHFSESSAIEPEKSAGDLEFPVDPTFRPLPRLVSIDVMIERIAELRRLFPDGIPTAAERLAAKVSEEFVL
jgi:hypothetical protein